ncbi:MAG: hypothetical protein COA91_05150 [Robiginitomaculum sp.]|nr:MAG: hypothetical protein COA91_05150 [Robiginitomaculum sp.]
MKPIYCLVWFVMGSLLSACTNKSAPPDNVIDSPASAPALPKMEVKTLPLNKEAITAARLWYDRQGLDFKAISDMPLEQRAARLNQAVYAYCQHGSTPGHINNLFENCKAACGGYSYVLRGVLEATGIRTRYVNLYNIPNQGNHTVVEVEIDGRWPFYDPTFGAYFTDNGQADGKPLNVEEVAYWEKETEIGDLVLQSKKEKTDILTGTLSDMYQYDYDHPYMKVENYQAAETLWHEGMDQITILDIGLSIEDGLTKIGDFSAKTKSEMHAAYFRETGAILLDDDPRNDISFRTSYLYNSVRPSITTLTVDGTGTNQNFNVRLMFFNPHTKQTRIQMMALDKSAVYHGQQVIALPPGRSIVEVNFTAMEDVSRLAVRNMGPSILAYLYGIEVLAQ